MTLYKPTLIIKRMVIKRDNGIAYDEIFHSGVNVIRGDNSSGKSTLINFIFYGLGGDLNDWSDIALLCTHVWLEVEINGNPATLRREISNKAMSPMEIYGGRYDDAQKAPIESWKKYPYGRSANIESFSQALFRLMDMPDVASELSGNVTIHQILRLIYADQLSPIDKVFRDESFDHANLRETVGNLLCGSFDNDIYQSQQLLIKKEKDFNNTSAELKSIISILGGEESMGVDWVLSQKNSFERERNKYLEEIAEAEKQNYQSDKKDRISLKEQNSVYKKVQKLQKILSEVKEKIREYEFDISDSNHFIRQIENKIESMRDAESIASFIHKVDYQSCPACHSKIENSPDKDTVCSLCNNPFDKKRAKERIAGLINEAAIQLNQSKQLQAIRINDLADLKATETRAISSWKEAARELQMLQVLPTTAARQKMRELSRKIGYVDRQIDDLENKLKLAQKVQELMIRKQNLAGEIDSLNNKISLMKSTQTAKLSKAREMIEKETIALLKSDLKRQDSFENPDSVSFSFKSNKIKVDEHSYFSASSRVILKCSFMLGFLNAALKNSSFRHPRINIIDITENNGMEMQRSYNLQHQIMKISEEANVEHQIIYATAFPSPEIDDENFVGDYATRDNRTLKILT